MVEILIIAALVLWSCVVVFKKVMPKTANRFFTQLANACQQKGWTTLAKQFSPKANSGCGGSCSCGDEEKSQIDTEVKTVKWK